MQDASYILIHEIFKIQNLKSNYAIAAARERVELVEFPWFAMI